MKDIKYKITFHTYWHCSSGLAAGADVDSLVIKDKDGLPYIPGKTLKGLFRDAVEDLANFGALMDEELFDETFGYFADKENHKQGSAFFSNAEFCDADKEHITNDVKKYLYSSVSRTAIDKLTGVAKEHSLRKQEVVIPCSLHAIIKDVPEKMVDIIIKSMGMIKRIGAERNRGLGRCTVEYIGRDGEI